ncbi:EF-P beta-lysylation protein EpmB [Aliidiomarina halalkaliphila]|uniref:L-lysine 2,3-aminomutase n=1 Tax=Aliidiomarina halalkaliphila TaxID=2593535 RepID=A0A552X0E0_9GAMM|nr:EF-P beta-lysylation protein EpmB [Aliidiomarina halalkaliphila]TRW48528.1 EF-P beta-lysylation protein EpmB [Aliidiomarina halalkaliphila]
MADHAFNIQLQSSWQRELAQSFTSPQALADYLQLPADWVTAHESARSLFPMRVPKPFAALMEPGNTQDPLLLQVLPQSDEFAQVPGYSTDPLDEKNASQIPGLLHKYKSRVLVIFRGGCAVNCRYCFRRHFPYQEHHISKSDLDHMCDYIAQHPDINEVILSGGDPLMASDAHVVDALHRFTALAQIRRVRIHTRLPVVIPQRLTSDLGDALSSLPVPVTMVLHINHAHEVSTELSDFVAQWRQRGIHFLNQSVLLKAINDSLDAQIALHEAVFRAGILPYYLHQLDPVSGAAHFAVDDAKALKLHQQMQSQLPGFLVPTLVRELAGEPNKTPLR